MKYKTEYIDYLTDNDVAIQDSNICDEDLDILDLDDDFLSCYHLGQFIYYFYRSIDANIKIVGDKDLYFYILGWSLLNG